MNIFYKLIENVSFFFTYIFLVTIDFAVSIVKFFGNVIFLNSHIERIKQMAINLDSLTAEVARVQTVQASAVTLLDSLTHELEKISADLAAQSSSGAADTAALNDLIDKLKVSTDGLAAAVANVPAKPQTEAPAPQQ
jgi:low affinity Fe/Cu permease